MDNNLQGNFTMQQEPKKNNVGMIVCIAVAVVVIIAAACAIGVFAFGGSPKSKANKAFDKMNDEFAQYTTPIGEIEFDKINENAKENPMHLGLDLSMTFPENEDVGNVKVDIDAISDLKNSAWSADVGAGAYGISLDLGSITYADDAIYVKSRYLGSDTYKVSLSNIAEDFNNSAWSTLLGTTLPEDVLEPYEEASVVDLGQYSASLTEILKEAKASFEFEKLKGKKEVELDGKTVKCTGIEITLGKECIDDTIDSFFDVLSDGFADMAESAGSAVQYDEEEFNSSIEALKSLEVEDDVRFDIYLDTKGCIVNISTPEDIEITSSMDGGFSGAVSFDLDFLGSERRSDVIKGDIYVQAEDEIICLNVDRAAEVSKDEYDEDIVFTLSDDKGDDSISISYTNTWGYEDDSFDLEFSVSENDKEAWLITANGEFEDVVAGESYTLNLKNAKLTVNGEDLLILSGDLTYEPSSEEVETPEASVDIFKMTQTEIQSIIYGIWGSLYTGLS